MSKTINLTPTTRIMPAEQELTYQYTPNELPLGANMGGLQMYSNVFKRGNGDKVFGSSEDGIWLGAANFADAPFSVDMDGFQSLKSKDGKSIKLVAADNQILICDENDVPIGHIGYAEGLY
jgi:hypothetical protein